MNRPFWVPSAVILVFLAACSPSQQGSGPTSAGYPVTVAHRFGSTTLDRPPLRVVSVGLVEQDAFVALGVVPVATREWYGKVPGALFPWAKARAGGAPLPQVLDFELDFEAIAALNPDLIVGLYSGLTQEEFATLSKIAPTVAQPVDTADWRADWKTITTTAGVLLNKQDEAASLIAGVEARFDEVRRANPDLKGKSAVLLSYWGWPTTYYAYGSEDPRVRLLRNLGLNAVAEVDQLAGGAFGASVSRERLDIADADVALWCVENPEQEAALKTDPLWAGLKAATQGRDVFLRENTEVYNALTFASVLSLPVALDTLVPLLKAAADGDPATR